MSSPHRNNLGPAIKPWSSAPDRSYPFLSDPPVWRDNESRRRALLVTRAILAVLRENAAMKCDSEMVKSTTQEGATAVFKPDPYGATQCDGCGQHKPTVRSRRVIEIGMQTGNVRAKFCDECAAIVVNKLKGTPSEAAAPAANDHKREAEAEAAAAEQKTADHDYGDKSSRQRDHWIGSIKTAIMAVAALALSTFLVSNYNSHPHNYPADAVIARSPEIRRAIPVEPEIRRAIPVAPEVRKAIPLHNAGSRARTLTNLPHFR